MENIIANLIALAIRKHEMFQYLSESGSDLADSYFNEYLGVVDAVAVAAGVSSVDAYKMVDEVMYA